MSDQLDKHAFCIFISIVKFIDQSREERYFMAKIETNSVNYNTLIGSDFKHRVPSHKKGLRQPIYFIFSLAALFVGVIIVSVVLANSSQSSSNKSTSKKLISPNSLLSPSSNDLAEAAKPVVVIAENQATKNTLTAETFVQSELAFNESETTSEIQEFEIAPLLETESSTTETIAIENVESEQELTQANVITIEVEKGDTLSSIFNNLDIHSELTRLLNLGKEAKPFKRIYPGQKLHFTLVDNKIEKLELEKSITKSLFLYSEGDTFVTEETERELDKVSQIATGSIDQSLFLAGMDAGMSDGLIMDLAAIFGWDIDFALDMRVGDNFTVLYEELYLDGDKVADGNIIAAEFMNNGKTYRAYRYTDSNGKTEYYSPDGKSMRKPFMRTPVDLARISSHFNLRRKHPVLNRIRAHKGVDYAASRGTPIKATGDGKVVHRGKKGGYGNTIILRHGNTYTTLYAHMSKYARSTGVGSRVKQGQIIGYIGSTGLATGPHLHYEFRVNGVHRNPLKVKLPSANPLPKSEMDSFQTSIQPLMVQLDAYTQNALVLRDQ